MGEQTASQTEQHLSDPIIYVDRSAVRDGKLAELKEAMDELVNLIERRNRGWSRTTCTSTRMEPRFPSSMYIDSASLEPDEGGGPGVSEVRGVRAAGLDRCLRQAERILIDQLRQKAQLLGGATVRVHELHAGLARLG